MISRPEFQSIPLLVQSCPQKQTTKVEIGKLFVESTGKIWKNILSSMIYPPGPSLLFHEHLAAQGLSGLVAASAKLVASSLSVSNLKQCHEFED